MTKKQVMKSIFEKATEMGLKTERIGLSKEKSITTGREKRYADIRILILNDSENSDYKNGIFAGMIEVEASICRMGGDTTPEELLEAAEEIRLAAEFVKACQSMDLSYREDINGNAA